MCTPNFTNMSQLLLCTRSNCLDTVRPATACHGKLRRLADYDGATEIEMWYDNNPSIMPPTHLPLPSGTVWLPRLQSLQCGPLSSNSTAPLSRNGLSLPVIDYVSHCLLNMSTRCLYTTSEKLTIIRYAEEHGNRAVSPEYDGVSESNVRLWWKWRTIFSPFRDSKMAECGSSAIHPELETKLLEWKMQLVSYTWLVTLTLKIILTLTLIQPPTQIATLLSKIYNSFRWSAVDLHCPANSQNLQIMQDGHAFWMYCFSLLTGRSGVFRYLQDGPAYNPSGYAQDSPAYNAFWCFSLFTGQACI